MKDRIVKFWNEHESVQLVCGIVTGAAVVLVPLAIQAKALQVTAADEITFSDGRDGLIIRQRNGNKTSLKKRDPIN